MRMINTHNSPKGIIFWAFMFFIVGLFQGCSEDNPTPGDDDPDLEDPIDPNPSDESTLITIDASVTYQTMVGFGGALTWYCDRITSSSRRDEIIDNIVNDLGLDILRLKNWYYPVDYPTNKVPNEMETSWFIYHYDATNELYDLVKTANPDIKVLFSSWGPPSYLKSNGQLDRGTLRKEGDVFMYEEYATYWEDVFDNITFVPDYLSIQNEPTWLADWETCEWSPTETVSLPSYEIAFDLVSDRLSPMSNPPIMVGPESADLSQAGFDNFANELRDNPNLGVYGYHPYNFNNGTSVSQFQSTLTALGNNFSDKPKFMTEYSGMGWFKTAQFINSTLREANTAAYLYWTLMWDENSDDAMIKVTSGGSYELTEFYYLMKHYAKFVDEGYVRLDLTASDPNLDMVGFLSPDATEVTVIVLNASSASTEISFAVDGQTVGGISSFQSVENNTFVEMEVATDEALSLPRESVTTVILELN